MLCCVSHKAALQIYQTSLRSLDLDSLREIRSGDVIVKRNADLCYADNIQWKKLMVAPGQLLSILRNRNHSYCGKYLFSMSAPLSTNSHKRGYYYYYYYYYSTYLYSASCSRTKKWCQDSIEVMHQYRDPLVRTGSLSL